MLSGVDPGFETLAVIVSTDGHNLGCEHRTVVNALVGHEMDHHTRAVKTVAQMSMPGIVNGVRTGELTGQRWMKVHHPAWEMAQKLHGQQMHPTGQHNQVGAMTGNDSGQIGVVAATRLRGVVRCVQVGPQTKK